jgi:hypothetical protein
VELQGVASRRCVESFQQASTNSTEQVHDTCGSGAVRALLLTQVTSNLRPVHEACPSCSLFHVWLRQHGHLTHHAVAPALTSAPSPQLHVQKELHRLEMLSHSWSRSLPPLEVSGWRTAKRG